MDIRSHRSRASWFLPLGLAVGMNAAAFPARADGLPASELIGSFASSCPSQGEWTNTALSQTQLLINAFQKLADDPACQTLAGAVGSLQSVQNQLSLIKAANAQDSEVAKARATEQMLLLQLGTATDAERPGLQAQLRAVQISLATMDAARRMTEEQQARQREALLNQAVASTNTLLTQAAAGEACLQKRPSLLSGIVALGGSVSAAAMLTNPALAIGLDAGTRLFGRLVEQGRRWGMQRNIRKLNEDVTFKAFSCVLESLGNRWCTANDALRVLAMKDEALREPTTGGGLVAAVRLYDREIPVLLNWLDALRLGEDPRNTAEADRRNKIFFRQALVQTSRTNSLAQIEESLPLFNAIDPGNTAERWLIQRGVIRRILQALGGTCFGSSCPPVSPFLDIYERIYAPYYLMGLPKTPTDKNGLPIDFEQYQVDPGYVPNLAAMSVRVRDWYQLAAARVNAEAALVLQPDALKALTDAIDGARDGVRLRPLDALIPIQDFLIRHEPERYEHGSFRQIYRDTLNRLTAIRGELEAALREQNPKDPRAALSAIFDLADLQNGLLLLRGRFDLVVRLALYEMFSQYPQRDQDLAAAFLAADRLLDNLNQVAGPKPIVLHREDIEGSLPVTLGALWGFTDVFGESIRDSLEVYRDRERKLAGPSNRVFRAERARMCLKLLAAPNWPKEVPAELCTGLQLEAAQRGGPASSPIDLDLIRSSHERRACEYRDYVRRSIIYERSFRPRRAAGVSASFRRPE